VHLVPVDIQELVRHLVRLKTPLAEQRALRFRTRLALRSPTIRVDPQKIKEAVANLINNAMEATPNGGQIDIRLSDERLSGGQPAIRVEIQDSGPGVARSIQDQIFEPFVSTKTRPPATAGSAGLGLSIARRNVRAHGGTIEVENAAASGALFRIILPVERRRS
jgi:signal transduction histidine kinase